MKTMNKPGDTNRTNGAASTGKNNNSSKSATNPKKPNNDPDQTPNREVENVPKAGSSKASPASKNKIGFKK